MNQYVVEAATREQQQIALWSLSAVDWGPLATPAGILRRLRRVQASDIVLMHDGPLRHNCPDKTVRVLPVLLALLARHGPAAAALPGTATMSE